MDLHADLQTLSRRHRARGDRLRRRALFDMLLVLLATLGAALLGADSHEGLLGATAALALGILFYVIRRDRDLVALAAGARWREQAVQGRGVPVSAWRAGARLLPWEKRRPSRGPEGG